MKNHTETHFVARVGWLRAAVLGANDGIVSTASLVMGVAAANAPKSAVLVAGVAGLVAGAMSMAAGEYVSVSSQSDTEKADLNRERRELEENPEFEHAELTEIYVARGLERGLAAEVATQLMNHDALGSHLRDELGLSEIHSARPVQAALASALTFAIGAALPLVCVSAASATAILPVVAVGSLLCLAGLGSLSAWAGGARPLVSVIRVSFWGALAMLATTIVGRLFGTVVA
jgi:VIT1/CCC1 family predicted Fe2+/Mn2+ transporter